MNRVDLVNNLRDKLPSMSAKEVDMATRIVFNQIKASLIAGEGVEIRGFGHFTIRTRPSYNARNPRTGKGVQVPEKKRIHFRTGLLLQRMLNPNE